MATERRADPRAARRWPLTLREKGLSVHADYAPDGKVVLEGFLNGKRKLAMVLTIDQVQCLRVVLGAAVDQRHRER